MGLDAREAAEVLVKGGRGVSRKGAAQLQSDIFTNMITHGVERDNSCGSFGKRIGAIHKNTSTICLGTDNSGSFTQPQSGGKARGMLGQA